MILRHKEEAGDRLFLPPSSTVLKYRDSEAQKGKLIKGND